MDVNIISHWNFFLVLREEKRGLFLQGTCKVGSYIVRMHVCRMIRTHGGGERRDSKKAAARRYHYLSD